MIEFIDVSFAYPEARSPIFEGLTLTVPDGIVSCIGQNGTGKSTFLLLGGGRLLPHKGTVLIDGQDTKQFATEEARAPHAAFVYQNMEFETEEPVADLLAFVQEHGFRKDHKDVSISELVEVFELQDCLSVPMHKISKGELQRTILAFSLLYGSKNLLMDEPVFALEDKQKHRALEYITGYVRTNSIGFLYSLHELELSRLFSDYLLIFYRNASPQLGATEKMFQRDIIEKAYNAPLDTLKRKETLFREVLIRLDKAHREKAKTKNQKRDHKNGSGRP